MKRLIACIVLSVISLPFKGLACYFYPYGEEIRFSIFNPDNFNYNGFRTYNYTSTYFYEEDYTTNLNNVTENDLMWYNHCRKRVPITEIKKAVFEIDLSEFTPSSNNQFIQYLYKQKDFETINYLLFAKETEKLSPDGADLWENNEDIKNKFRDDKIKEAFTRIKSVRNPIIKKRYYYQIFKMLSYMGNPKRTIDLYDSYSKIYTTKDFLDNWALFYRMNAEPDNNRMNYLAAQVFARGTDNKFDIKWYFNRKIPIENVLKFAKNDEERCNIHVLYSFRKIDQNLQNIKRVYSYDPKNAGLSFLLLREINKMEDWILTPTYTMYLPVLREDYWENSNGKRILDRAEVDRKYAAKVLDFVNTVDMNAVDDKDFWMLSKSYLEFLTKQYPKALETITSFENNIKNEKTKRQCDMIKALVVTADQPKNNAKIVKSIENTILKEYQQKNYSFLFAIAKELEILENKADAAFLISRINPDEYYNSTVYWRSRSNKITLHDDFYYDWYGYVDAELSISDMQSLLATLNASNPSGFDRWKTQNLRNEPNKVNDLMGIKCMRGDNLKLAYQYFSKVDKNHYTNAPLFNENPFYKIKGYMNYDTKKTAQNLTKAKVVLTLMELIKTADNVKNKNRSQDYFLIANCYYNMSYDGNSWMMKRISRTGQRDSNYEDDSEYYCSQKARFYYQKAFENSTSKKFRAISSYMMSKCNANRNEYRYLKQYEKDFYADYDQLASVRNQAFSDFMANYKSEYNELMSNCELFSVYFKSR